MNKLPALRRALLPGLLACALGVGAAVHAHDDDHDLARQALEERKVLPLRGVLDKVEREIPGQVLQVEFERDDGRYVYKIRLLQPDGRIAKLKVDAQDGRVLGIKRRELESDAHPRR